MEGENQTHPLASAGTWQRSDQELAPDKSLPPQEGSGFSKCFVFILLLLVVQAGILLVFALVFWRVETPEFRHSDPAVRDLRYATSRELSLNATLMASATIRNTNFGRCSFENGTLISVLYMGQPFGYDTMMIREGRARARYTETVRALIELRSSWLVSDEVKTNLRLDLDSGRVQFSTRAKLIGRVHVMGIVKRRTSEMNCTMTLNLTSHDVQDVQCK